MLERTGKHPSEEFMGLEYIAWEHLGLLDPVAMNFLCEVVCQLIAADVTTFRKQDLPCTTLALAHVRPNIPERSECCSGIPKAVTKDLG